MASPKKNILKKIEGILDDEPVIDKTKKHEGSYISTPPPDLVEQPRVHNQYKDLRHLLCLFNYRVSEDGDTYTKHFASKKYDIVLTFLKNGKIQIDCSAAERKILDISDAFNWIY